MITGLGLSGGAWWRTVPVLSQSLRVITFDSRGVGRSRARLHSYTTEAMADDAVSVLDAAGVEQAHVYGFSLGGMVAQQLALRHPERLRSLVLGATHPGGPRAVRPSAEVIAFFRRRASMTARDAARASVPFNYGPRCRRDHSDRIAEDIRRRLAHPFPEQAYRAQIVAATLHNTYRRLKRIEAPTLIVHGREDRVIPRRQRRGPRRAHPACPAAHPRGGRSSVLDRAAGGRRGDRAVLPGGPMSFAVPDVRVADVIRRHAVQRPEAVALRQGERELTYGDLDERSNRLAQALLAHGVRAGARVAYLDRSSPEVIELLFAASKAGAVLVPLNWRLAPPELAAVLADAQAPVLIAGPDFREVAEDVVQRAVAGAGPASSWARTTSAGSRLTSRAIPAAAASPAT